MLERVLKSIFRAGQKKYQLEALVSSRLLEQNYFQQYKTHIICDLDKTYVETEFESWVKMAKIPFERPHEKITVPGASEVLNAARWSIPSVDFASQPDAKPHVGLHFVSSSPPQLRSALDGKLVLDRLDWTSDTFKNQSYNLKMARLDLLKHHIAYKTKAILDIMKSSGPESEFWMIGDNAEFDSYIYVGLKLFIEGTLTLTGLRDWLLAAKVEGYVVDQVLQEMDDLPKKSMSIGGILIRKLSGYPLILEKNFGGDFEFFDHWFQIGWRWLKAGMIHPSYLWRLVREYHNFHGVPLVTFKNAFEGVIADPDGISPELKDEVLRVYHRLVGLSMSGVKDLVDELSLQCGARADKKTELDESINKLKNEASAIDAARRWYANIVLHKGH